MASENDDKGSYYRKLTSLCEKVHEFKELQDTLFLRPGEDPEERVHSNPNFYENYVEL